MKELILFISLLTISNVNARITDDQVTLKIEAASIKVSAKKDFHLNDKAPAKMIISKLSKSIKPKTKTPSEFEFDLTEGKFSENQKVYLDYYVCDDKNTVCEKHALDLQVKAGSLEKISKDESLLAENENITQTKGIIAPIKYNHHQFILDNLQAGLDLAKKEKKLV